AEIIFDHAQVASVAFARLISKRSEFCGGTVESNEAKQRSLHRHLPCTMCIGIGDKETRIFWLKRGAISCFQEWSATPGIIISSTRAIGELLGSASDAGEMFSHSVHASIYRRRPLVIPRQNLRRRQGPCRWPL